MSLGLGCFDYKQVNMRTKLSVNINKVATIRNARGGNNPDIIKVAKDCEAFGADGITVHPRPDERHIRRADVPALQAVLRTEFNIEGYPSRDFLDLVLRVRPSQVTLVPDKPEQLTSNSGWDTEKEQLFLRDVLNELREAGIRSSIFIDADVRMAEFAAEAGADRVELYTGPYAHGYATDRDAAIAPFLETAKRVRQLGIGLNAGHDLSLENLKFFTDVIPWVDEVSIGHALISDALYMGLEATIAAYKNCLKK
jgi:pyridoxine 5-phosphate synthase